MWNGNFYTEQFRFSVDNILVYQCKSSACTWLKVFLMFGFVSEILYFVLHLVLSSRQRMYMVMYIIPNACLSPKVWPTTLSKSFLKKKILLLHGFHTYCLTSLTACEGKCHFLGLYWRVQRWFCIVMRFWFVLRWELATNCVNHEKPALWLLFWNCVIFLLLFVYFAVNG